ncbi:uncharacterized protein CCOS01_06447 [Colletotrichum costaricense]|uniref:Uncharacterized protein n=1 Tax=Colletotrichum costaricense TaxID=1209916 RepID=A0AAJ0E0P9_9PEZI|nr:uncharacterized protein CCOS01_06447 [Colletotrichum costaricense]KAK1528613.1 hypothetical protein CCOS01_06447 [Colletotrichum costaricense]
MAEHETHEETHDSVPDGFLCTFCSSPYLEARGWRLCEESHSEQRIQDLNGIYWVCSLPDRDNDSRLCNTSFKVTQRFEFAQHLTMMHGVGTSWSVVLSVQRDNCFPIHADGFWCGYCRKALKYDDPQIQEGLSLTDLDQPLRLDHIQKHILNGTRPRSWQWPRAGVTEQASGEEQ